MITQACTPMKVHNKLGPGFPEVIYQRSLAIELGRAGLSFQREKEQVVYYDNIKVGIRRADFIVEQDKDIDVGVWMQFTTSITTYGN